MSKDSKQIEIPCPLRQVEALFVEDMFAKWEAIEQYVAQFPESVPLQHIANQNHLKPCALESDITKRDTGFRNHHVEHLKPLFLPAVPQPLI